MSEPPGLQENPPSSSTTTTLEPTITPAATWLPGSTEWNDNLRTLMLLCSLGIIGCFFLPWVQIFFGKPSGYELQQLPSDEVKLLWLIPLTAGVALFASIFRQSMVIACQAAGAMPYLALAYYYHELGQSIFEALQIGAYLTLICGVVLLIAPRLLKKLST
jgi:hypothetical protein